MLLALPVFIGVDIIMLSQILSILFGVLIFPLTYFIAKEISIPGLSDFSNSVFNLLPLIMLAFTGGFHYWSVSGMETTLFSFLVLFSTLSYLRFLTGKSYGNVYIILLMLATLTRPEGLVFFCIFIAHKVLFLLSRNGFSVRKALKQRLLFNRQVLFYILPISVFTLFRLLYYGYPFPNTYYAKTSYEWFYISRGLEYLWDSLAQNFLYGLMLITPALLIFGQTRSHVKLFLFFMSVSYLAVVVLLGGDVLPFNRFIIPVMPIIFILFIKSIEYMFLLTTGGRRLIITNFAIGLFFLLIPVYSYMGYSSELSKINDHRDVEEGLVTKMSIYAEWVNEQIVKSGEAKIVALSTIGSFSYHTDANVIDLIGLTDEYIAHNPVEVKGIAENVSVLWTERRYNVDYVLDREPDYIIFPAGAKPSAFPESALYSRERFIKNYYLQLIYSNELRMYLPVFTKKSQSAEIIGDKFYEICDLKFVGHYITANNEFIRFVRDKSEERFVTILDECKKMIDACPGASSEAYTTIGFTYYHKGDNLAAEKYLLKAIDSNEMNSMPYVYLIDLMNKTDRRNEAVKYMKLLKQLSPDALPNIEFPGL